MLNSKLSSVSKEVRKLRSLLDYVPAGELPASVTYASGHTFELNVVSVFLPGEQMLGVDQFVEKFTTEDQRLRIWEKDACLILPYSTENLRITDVGVSFTLCFYEYVGCVEMEHLDTFNVFDS